MLVFVRVNRSSYEKFYKKPSNVDHRLRDCCFTPGRLLGGISLCPPMRPGEKKIGIVTSDLDSYKSSLIIYNQDLKRQRQKSLKSFGHAGLGFNCYRQPISDGHFFLEANGIFGLYSIEDFISIDMEKETAAAYPVSTKMGLLGVAANQDYAYSLTNVNAESVIAQHSRRGMYVYEKEEAAE